MLFRIIRKVQCGSLSIKITFEQSDEPPCDHMTDHAAEVEASIVDLYEDTDKSATLVAMEIVDKFRRVSGVRIEDEETGECIICESED